MLLGGRQPDQFKPGMPLQQFNKTLADRACRAQHGYRYTFLFRHNNTLPLINMLNMRFLNPFKYVGTRFTASGIYRR
jgi:hypothetical protein